MRQIILIAVAGAAGTLARFGLSTVVQRYYGEPFPLGTMVVNVLGAFLFGVVWALADDAQVLTPEARAVILTGFMGAFTTFSTFMFDSSKMFTSSMGVGALLNLGLSVVLGLLAVSGGLMLVRALV